SLSLEHPLRVQREQGPLDEEHFSVNGTPTDCVHLAITGLLQEEQDMVISGINHGANLGDDVLYSGTVAAAMEGRFLGLPAIAISLVSQRPDNLVCAAKVAYELVSKLASHELSGDTILNVNVPDLPYEKIKGFQVTRLGNRHRSEQVIPTQDPKGSTLYWIGPVGEEGDAGDGTDFFAVNNGYVSITPIHTDLTQHAAIGELQSWLA
ncbi:MAG: 5'/3'-nucleotidase SurE, partial [Gammaproteobacteria bacterium]|nr:5'/3'-nucleotidase SurE [Gammaproteobacteria bacterium]